MCKLLKFKQLDFVQMVKKVKKYVFDIEYLYKLSLTSRSLEEYKKACSIYVKNTKLLEGEKLKEYTDRLAIDLRNIAKLVNIRYQAEVLNPLINFTSYSIGKSQYFEALKKILNPQPSYLQKISQIVTSLLI